MKKGSFLRTKIHRIRAADLNETKGWLKTIVAFFARQKTLENIVDGFRFSIH
jgi:hypothetical protein